MKQEQFEDNLIWIDICFNHILRKYNLKNSNLYNRDLKSLFTRMSEDFVKLESN